MGPAARCADQIHDRTRLGAHARLDTGRTPAAVCVGPRRGGPQPVLAGRRRVWPSRTPDPERNPKRPGLLRSGRSAVGVSRKSRTRSLSLLTFGPIRNSRRIVATTFYEENGEVSPGGRWLAYESDESGQKEVYVRPFPKVGDGRWQVSAGGGKMPAWARSGTELFYLSLTGAMMAAPIQSGFTFAAGTPVKLFEGRYFPPPGPTYSERSYDVSADGRGFLMIKKEGDLSQVPGIVVIESWLDELRARVPAK